MKKLLSLLFCISAISCSTYELNIVHANDHHSHLEADNMSIVLNGKKVKADVGGFSSMVTKINELRNTEKNVLTMHAGDAITGTMYYSLFKGDADADMMNVAKFDVFALGNHEFDGGNEGLVKLLDRLENIPTVSSNVIAPKGSVLYKRWTPYIIKEIGGEKIGIIGLEVTKKTKESSSPGPEIVFKDELETAQQYADIMKELGINKVILLSHAGTEKNMEIAQKVSGIDVIVSGDTHYLYGDQYKENGFNPYTGYPTVFKSPAGEPVYVVEAWQYSWLLGHLKVKFDDKGIVTEAEGKPVLFVKDEFRVKKDGKYVTLEGKEKQELLDYIAKNPYIEIARPDEKAEKVLSTYRAEKEVLAKQILGKIVGEAMPGGSENRIPSAVNPKGSIATRLVTESMMDDLKSMGTGNIDLTIQNSGGVRSTILPGDYSYNDVMQLLPFGNTLAVVEMKGADVEQVIEDALQFALVDGSTGAFPYGAGIRYEAVKTPINGKRVIKVEIQNRKTNKWEKLDPNKVYVVGTNSYIAGGKDGYKTFKKYNFTDTFLPDNESFIKYLKKNKELKSFTESNVKFHYNR